MSDIAIRVENLGKQYHIGSLQTGYKTIRETLVDAVQSPFRRLAAVARGKASGSYDETIWALRDISFVVKRGEAVGLIGHNGAGKSTLLKILSRITEPTTGYAEIKGRVGSLLEVGTGFHPELTGRENIYLNGVILGMKRAEIDRNFDEIVAFAGVEKFIDTPVKHYSSGMGVRLAFSVAAHLESEILLVDEVLAVGDIAFQRKCLGKMGDIAKAGRTVLFVSHNMAAILNLCKSGILLNGGRVSSIGLAPDIVQLYLAMIEQNAETSLRHRADRGGDGFVRAVEFKMSPSPHKNPETDFMLNDEVYMVLTVEAPEPTEIYVGIQIKDSWGNLIFAFNSREGGFSYAVKAGETDLILQIPKLPFLEGRYTVGATINRVYNLSLCDMVEKVNAFVMHPKDVYNSGAPFSSQHGLVFVEHKWLT